MQMTQPEPLMGKMEKIKSSDILYCKYEPTNEWVAIAEVMGIIGCGKTPEQAREVLLGCIRAHINYLAEHDEMRLLYSPISKEYINEIGGVRHKESYVLND